MTELLLSFSNHNLLRKHRTTMMIVTMKMSFIVQLLLLLFLVLMLISSTVRRNNINNQNKNNILFRHDIHSWSLSPQHTTPFVVVHHVQAFAFTCLVGRSHQLTSSTSSSTTTTRRNFVVVDWKMSANKSNNNNNNDDDDNNNGVENDDNQENRLMMNQQQQPQQQQPETMTNPPPTKTTTTTITTTSTTTTNGGGYRFGDITRGVWKRLEGKVTTLTGKKESYQFGDLTRQWLLLDRQGNKDQIVQQFTENKTSTVTTTKTTYQFGDISREIIRRLKDGEYTQDDLMLFIKIVVTVGINITPVTRTLPVRVLLDMLNLTLEASIVQTVGERVVSSITNEIDRRMKEMVTGDRDYQFGDITKRTIAKWAGKDRYEFGDFTRTLFHKLQERRQMTKTPSTPSSSMKLSDYMDNDTVVPTSTSTSFSTADTLLDLNQYETELLEAWDREFLSIESLGGDNNTKSNKNIVEGRRPIDDDGLQYSEWDEKFLSS